MENGSIALAWPAWLYMGGAAFYAALWWGSFVAAAGYFNYLGEGRTRASVRDACSSPIPQWENAPRRPSMFWTERSAETEGA